MINKLMIRINVNLYEKIVKQILFNCTYKEFYNYNYKIDYLNLKNPQNLDKKKLKEIKINYEN